MRSFIISALATLAFGVFCSAAPTPVGVSEIDLSPAPVAVRDTPAAPVENPTLQTVLGDVPNTVNSLIAQISGYSTLFLYLL